MKTPCSLLRSGETQPQRFFAGLFFISLLFSGIVSGQQTSLSKAVVSQRLATTNFTVKPFTPYFVENKGQFDQYDANKSAGDFKSPSYGSQMGNAIVLFNGSSVQFVETIVVNKEKERRGKPENLLEEREIETHRQTMTFVNANPSATFEAEKIQPQ